MKKIVLILLFLNVSTAYANENIFFAKIPSYITADEAIIAVTKAALGRKWMAQEYLDNKLRVQLNHREYQAILVFSFSDSEIFYSDYSKMLDQDTGDSFAKEWEMSPAPKSWVRNLRNDVSVIFSNPDSMTSLTGLDRQKNKKKLERLRLPRENGLAVKNKVFFSNIPSNITVDEAVNIVNKAALGRKWKIDESTGKELRIELTHQGHKAILVFSFSEDAIYYSDYSKYKEHDEGDSFIPDWEPLPAPRSWVSNLKSDVNGIFLSYRRKVNEKTNTKTRKKSNPAESAGHKDIEKKLESLKKLYEKKLISESEYKQKKKEILSTF